QRVLDDLIANERSLVTDVEVLQEILHRYTAIGRPDAIQPAFDAILDVVDEVFGIDLAHVEAAKDIVHGASGLSARDAIHVAVMRTSGVEEIVSFDAAFDLVPGIRRLS